MENNNIREIFKVIIDGEEYSVYHIKDKEHNGEYNNWWLYTDKDCIPYGESDEKLIPYSSDINRRSWKIEFIQNTRSKQKYGELRYNTGTRVLMFCNGVLVYEFYTGGKDMSHAFTKAQYLQTILAEHPYNFFDQESEVGRKIFYYGLPATIGDVYFHGEGEITVVPDYDAGLTKEEWWKLFKERSSNYVSKNIDVESSSPYGDDDDNQSNYDKEYYEECMTENRIRHGSALQDGNIGWFRN